MAYSGPAVSHSDPKFLLWIHNPNLTSNPRPVGLKTKPTKNLKKYLEEKACYPRIIVVEPGNSEINVVEKLVDVYNN